MLEENRADTASLQVTDDLQAALGSGSGDDSWIANWHITLGSLAGLLIAELAGCDEALGLLAGDQSSEDHASALLNVLREVGSRTGTPPYIEPVALPLKTAAKTRPEMYRAILAWLRRIDLSSCNGRQVAADAFDAAIRFVVQRNGRRAGEFITPSRVADLMIELVRPRCGQTVYDPCFGFGDLLVSAARQLGTEPSGSTSSLTPQSVSVFGVEIGPAQYAIGLCRLGRRAAA